MLKSQIPEAEIEANLEAAVKVVEFTQNQAQGKVSILFSSLIRIRSSQYSIHLDDRHQEEPGRPFQATVKN